MRTLLAFAFIIICSVSAHAEPLLTTSLAGVPLIDLFEKQGVPRAATQRALEYLDQNVGKSMLAGDVKVRIKASSMAIIDYSLPSTEKRFYLMNLKTGTVEKFLVAHGKNSGVRYTSRFTNINDTKTTSLGLLIAGGTYIGFHGRSLNMQGVESSNDLSFSRRLVLHGAPYVSVDFIAQNGRLGRSWGCPAVEEEVVDHIIDTLQGGSLVYHYHPALMSQAVENPQTQKFQDPNLVDDEDIDLPGEEEDLKSK